MKLYMMRRGSIPLGMGTARHKAFVRQIWGMNAKKLCYSYLDVNTDSVPSIF